MSYEGDYYESDHNDRKEVVQIKLTKIEYELFHESVKLLAQDIKDLQIAFEQDRRDIAAGFVPRDILDLRVINMQSQMTVLEQKFSELREEMRANEQKSIGRVERIWLRVATTGGLIGVAVAILEYIQKVH